jgi:lipoprotein-anchoring transpeptidase ErfK/SrfK
VDLRRQVISLFRGGNEIATAVIIYCARNKPTPLGRFEVLGKDKDYRSAAYDAAMPYSLFLTRDGIAIHASDVRHRNATHGCIGVPIEFARRLFDAVQVGDPVDVVPAT